MNKEIANIFNDMAGLLEIKGDLPFRIMGYRRAAAILHRLPIDVTDIYREKKLKGLLEIKGIGQNSAKRIEQYIKSAAQNSGKGSIRDFDKLMEETALRQIITHFFASKGLSLQKLKENAKKRKIIYSRFTKPAKQLLELSGSIADSKAAIDTVAAWANSRKLDYTIETVFKKWLELDRLKPKEAIKKPFYQGDQVVEKNGKKYVISKYGQWLLFAGKESEIEWREIK